MVAWLYFVQSNYEYHDLMSFLLNEEGISGISYLVFSEDVECSKDKVFHTSSGFLITVNFLSHSSDIREKIAEVGLNPKSLIDLYEIVCEDDNTQTKTITITEGAECIIFDKELERFFTNKHFRFSDDTALTIPQISLKYRL